MVQAWTTLTVLVGRLLRGSGLAVVLGLLCALDVFVHTSWTRRPVQVLFVVYGLLTLVAATTSPGRESLGGVWTLRRRTRDRTG